MALKESVLFHSLYSLLNQFPYFTSVKAKRLLPRRRIVRNFLPSWITYEVIKRHMAIFGNMETAIFKLNVRVIMMGGTYYICVFEFRQI